MSYEKIPLLPTESGEEDSLFLSLLLDPLYIELARLSQERPWGPLKGATLYSVSSGLSHIEALAALWYVWFGRPHQTVLQKGDTSFQALFLYDHWTLQWAGSISKETLFPEPILQGSFLFSSAMVEFRYGSERWIAVSPDGEQVYHIPLPEAHPSLYLWMDAPGGVSLPDGALKKAAWDFARDMKRRLQVSAEQGEKFQ
ncbi:MAG: hypothetical protein N2509_03545 [Treponemataceae bacterium]|nr:hypothetical protein [Treponemataceae bacterium]